MVIRYCGRAVATPPTRPVLRERYERRRQEVVDAAAALFAERGFHATSMQDLQERTGLTIGGLYHYIGSKDQLLGAVCAELVDPLLAQARALPDTGDHHERLRAFLRLWVAHVATHRDHMLVFSQERGTLERDEQWATVRRSRKAFERLLDELLRAGEQDGAFRFADRRLAGLALLGAVNHLPLWYRPRGRLSTDEVADGFCAMVVGTA